MTAPQLPPDIEARIAADYAPEQHAAITGALTGLSEVTPEPVRVARCVLFVASANLEELERMIDLAHTDYRDAIVAAEYDRDLQRLRDFGWPFGEAEFDA